MNPLSLITKGYLSPAGEEVNNYYFPFSITIDYGEKDVSVFLEGIDLLVETEQEVLTIEAGQEELSVEIESINVEVKLD